MKKISIAVIAIIIGVCCFLAIPQNSSDNNEYIRLHIRANSNSEYDQSIKYTVKDRVVEYLTPVSKKITSKESMYNVLYDNLPKIKQVVDAELKRLGQNYKSNVKLTQEEFPTRTYQDVTLEGGIYDALIIELGSGTGDNWWCVAFPPLCFNGKDNGSDKVVYKSKIAEIFNNILKKR